MNELIGIVEACYDGGGTEEEWLAGLAGAALPFLDGGFGLLATTLASDASAGPSVRSVVAEQMRPEVAQALQHAMREEDPHLLGTALRRPVSSARSVFGEAYESRSRARPFVEPLGIRDSLYVSALNTDGSGVTLTVPLAEPRSLLPTLVRNWSRIAAHMAAGMRLRRIVPAEDDLELESEISPDGQTELFPSDGNDRPLRIAIREAAIALDLVRGPRRVTDPSQATEAWRALVEGQYTLFDHFDRGGRHFIVARANSMAAPGSASLTARERQVVAFRSAGHPLKLIAYELHLSVATVSRTLTTAMRKLGVRSHVELARALGSTGS